MVEDFCREFREDFLYFDKNTIQIRIKKIFYGDFVDFLRRNGFSLVSVIDKNYYIYLGFVKTVDIYKKYSETDKWV